MAADPGELCIQPLGVGVGHPGGYPGLLPAARNTFRSAIESVGKNVKAAFLMGVPTWQYSMIAFLICGAFAGLAGAIQVTSVYHRLTPAISSGYGFLDSWWRC